MKPIRLPSGLQLHASSGIPIQGQGPLIAEHIAQSKKQWIWLFLPDLKSWESLSAEIDCFLHLANPLRPIEHFHFPPLPNNQHSENLSSNHAEAELDRIALLSALTSAKPTKPSKTAPFHIVYTTVESFFNPVQNPASLQSDSIELQSGTEYAFDHLRFQLIEQLDYDAEALCEYPGQFSIRGGILDIYPVNFHQPVRIDFFGDEIEAIRTFDPTTQRSDQAIPSITIAPRNPALPVASEHRLIEYLNLPSLFIWLEPDKLYADNPAPFLALENTPVHNSNFTSLFNRKAALKDSYQLISTLGLSLPFLQDNDPSVQEWTIHSLEPYRQHPLTHGIGEERVALEEIARTQFFQSLKTWLKEKTALFLAGNNPAENNRMLELIAEFDPQLSKKIKVIPGNLRQGFRVDFQQNQSFLWLKPKSSRALVVLTEHEILGKRITRSKDNTHTRRRKIPQVSSVDQLLDFADLAEGDHLVHLAHGICIFQGLATMELNGRDEEIISLQFAEGITLHLPLYESHLLTRYVGLSKSAPKLGKIGSGSWEKSRRAAEKATLDYAGTLLRIQAAREKGEGHSFQPDTSWQRNFEAAFPHQETPDQLSAIENTKRDMEQPRPMDRLICGDVGYGKTEVAIRAAFKAVMDNRQVAILVPTTVLAQQHFNTFRDRMADYPITVEMVSRFRSPKQQKEILRQAKSGSIDILIGTHRILSKDIHFRDLGLLVIDEEHRFGVRHKERIKEMRTHVDVITMSATPIPRTLYLALMGARDLSTIDTPPANRKPIETIVQRYDDDVVRKAIRYELDRGGQVFYLHNRVQSIHSVAQKLEALVPDARIAIGHGQMPEEDLEKVMTQFVAGESDILLCTTIIENGLDIPNSNTIIIEGADRFGLSQLYQLRGRVGRFNRQAYAYLLLHRHTKLLNQAHERLSAMRQYNQLGAGFKIAMRDLELRGAGNLLGAEQSGHVASIGFELYCQLLRQSVSRLKGESTARHIRATVSLDFVTLGDSNASLPSAPKSIGFGFEAIRESDIAHTRIPSIIAFLPREYLTEPQLRIDFYRRLALAPSTTAVEAIETEMIDRFGKLPQPAKNIIQITRLRTLAQESGIISVVSEGNRLKCLRASGQQNDFLKTGSRFPRLTAQKPLLRLREIEQFLRRHRPK